MMLRQERSATLDRQKSKELCRICFSRKPTFLNVFETSVTNCMSIADMFMQCLGENMSPDDELPEFICCDCIEEIIEVEKLSEACQAALKYLVCRTRLLKHLEYIQGKERFTETPSNLALKIFITEDQSAHANSVPEEAGKSSFLLLSTNKIQDSYQCDSFKRGLLSETKFSMNNELNLGSCVHHCRFCNGVFLNDEDLNKHEYLFHNVRGGFPCGKCHKKFKSLKSLERHIEKKNFRCKLQGCVIAKQSIKNPSMKVCIQSPSGPSILKNEESNKAEIKGSLELKVSYSCGKCNCSFISKMNLRDHLREAHTAILPCICGVCTTGYPSQFELISHKLIHHRELSCTKCNRYFFSLNSYQDHIKFCVEKIGLYKCQFCGKGSSTKRNWKDHMVTHSLLKRIECHICHKGFRRTSDRSRHIRAIHLKQKPYECGICHKSFSLRNILVDHIKIHSDEKSYSCSLCGVMLKTRIAKYKHEKKVHKVSRKKERYIIEEETLQKALLREL